MEAAERQAAAQRKPLLHLGSVKSQPDVKIGHGRQSLPVVPKHALRRRLAPARRVGSSAAAAVVALPRRRELHL